MGAKHINLEEILASLREMDRVTKKIKGFGKGISNSLTRDQQRYRDIMADKELVEYLGNDSRYWNNRMAELETSVDFIKKQNKNVDFTMVENFLTKVNKEFFKETVAFITLQEINKEMK
jgi:adenylosuccinate synthase